MRRICFFFFALFTISAVFAQTGNIAGRVINGKTGEYISNVSVMIAETEQGMYTKESGSFIFKDLPLGNYTLVVNQIGFKQARIPVTVREGYTETIKVTLEIEPYALEGIRVNATRAVDRETPVAFTTLDEEEIADKYTTEDIPLLLEDVPGLFSSSSGLGESDISIRGFDAEKIQILINGIPVNDPESQKVYWSNWTGLSSNVKSVQVQRGAGSSMYGSGAFGGSVNIETMGGNPNREVTVRTSAGTYESGHIADGRGGKEDYHPVNYNVLTRFNSGAIWNKHLTYNLMVERKAGDSYNNGTTYDGWSFGAEALTVFNQHSINLSFIGAPQKHNQSRTMSDMELWDKLGRNYNRNNHTTQENYYYKPQASLRWDWNPDEFQQMRTNVFVTSGEGGGRYLAQDYFNTETGEVNYIETSPTLDDRVYRRHAMWAYLETGEAMDEMEILNDEGEYLEYNYLGEYYREKKDRASNAVNEYDHSRINDSRNEHFQYGTNLYYNVDLGNKLGSNHAWWLRWVVPSITAGGEYRVWEASHYAATEEWRSYDPVDSVKVYSDVQRRYDYDSRVVNSSVFGRTEFKPFDIVTLMADYQYASYYSEVEENPIEIYNFGTGKFTGIEYYNTKDMTEEDEEGNEQLKFSDDDYNRTFTFKSPKLGVNVNLTEELNILSNWSIAYKEPKVSNWYSYSSGPTDYDLDPEKAETWEVGMGLSTSDGNFDYDLNINYYHTKYTDKIGSAEWEDEETHETISRTINVGSATHSGWEIASDAVYGNVDIGGSLTIARYRWNKMNYLKVFNYPAEDIEGKVVPYSPEKMANAYLGYTFRFADSQKLRVGTTFKWWDEYYASYDNTYRDINNDEKEAKLPFYLTWSFDIKYSFKLWDNNASVRLDLNNVNNREENCESAYYGTDYGRNDILLDKKYMYVEPAPLFNVFLTMEYKF